MCLQVSVSMSGSVVGGATSRGYTSYVPLKALFEICQIQEDQWSCKGSPEICCTYIPINMFAYYGKKPQ